MGCAPSQDELFDYDRELGSQKELRSVEVKDNGDAKDLGPIHRSARFPDRVIDSPFESKDDKEACRTIWYGFLRGYEKFANRPCLGARKIVENAVKFSWLTYAETHAEVLEVAAGLLAIGLKPKDTIGICSANRAEWAMLALALYSQRMITVALYDTLGADAVEYITNHAETSVAACSKKKLPLLLGVIGEKCPKLKTIIQFDAHPGFGNEAEAVSQDDRKKAEEKGVRLIGWSELRELGKKERPALQEPPTSQDVAFIMYTSGTTGQPKGVVLTHGNVMACVGGVVRTVAVLKETDIHISYLPLAHIFETLIHAGVFCFGACIGFFSGDVKTLSDDIKALEPTLFAGVPRVFTRFHDKVMDAARGAMAIKRKVFFSKYYKQCYQKRRGLPQDASAEKIFKGVRAKLGLSRCRIVITGAAPCPPYLMEFLRVVINPESGVLQGYGMTETAAAVTASEANDHTLGHVGPPLPSVEIRLRDVPEMNYLHTNNPPTGEVLCRGPSIFQGYYKNPEATNSTLENGWIGTGDIGRWNPSGTLSIIDRKKNIFKLAHGEYVAAEKLEQIFVRSPYVAQVFVYGNSYKTFLVAVVVPNSENFARLAKEKGWWGNDNNARLASDEWRAHLKKVMESHREELTKIIMETIAKLSTDENLQAFERIKDIYIEAEVDELLQGFTVANDCMTPTFKLRRPFLLQRYKDRIVDLYTKHGEKPKPDEKW